MLRPSFLETLDVLFQSSESPSAPLTRRIERMLAAAFTYQVSVVLQTRKQLRGIVEQAPDGFGTQLDRHRYDVLFLKFPLTAPVAVKSVPTTPDVDLVAFVRQAVVPSITHDAAIVGTIRVRRNPAAA
jgi:uncharacterized protein (DUF1697 family)